MKLIIQIPCYNEEETLKIALDALPKHIDGIDVIEYLIINDGSKDNTVQVAKEWGVHHIVNFRNNKGLARGFMAGLDACLRNGADIIVNTDADNQYNADDIEKLVRPILNHEAGMVIGERPIDQTAHFSPLKKKLQHFGSWVVRKASKTDIPDAPSGFRAYSRHTAMRLNVVNNYTYTLETIVQAGQERMAVMSVPIRTNAELRPSRLFSGMWSYVKRSMVTILRSVMYYNPLRFFFWLSLLFDIPGLVFLIRYLVYVFMGHSQGHVQSLVVGGMLFTIGILAFLMGLVADVVAANRKLTEENLFFARRQGYGPGHEELKRAAEAKTEDASQITEE